MKTRSILFGAVLIAMTVPAFAHASPSGQGTMMDQSMRGMTMRSNGSNIKKRSCKPMDQGMQGMQMDNNTPCSSQTAQGTGVIEVIDRAKGTITIKHQAIASIHWPAMTMTFKADPPSLLKDLKVGEKVSFTLRRDGMQGTVTAIARAK